MGEWRLSDGWERVQDSRTPDAPEGEPGPWRDQDGAVLHGVYQRLVSPSGLGEVPEVEGVAAWHGSRLWSWSGPEMPRFRNPRVSPWNPVLAQGLRFDHVERTPYESGSWPDEWIADALLQHRKPYGRFALPLKTALDWFAEAGPAGLVYRATRDHTPGSCDERLHITASIAQTYGEVFDLDALIADYRDVLPERLAAEQAEALHAHRDKSIGLLYVLADDADERFWAAPRAVRGLTLGYPSCSTAARILADADAEEPVKRNGSRLNGSSVNGHPMLRVPECRHQGGPHVKVAEMPAALVDTVVLWIDRSWPADMPRGVYPEDAEELARSGYMIAIAYRAYVTAPSRLRVSISDDPHLEEEMHRHICCLLRGLSKEPREIQLDAWYARKDAWYARKMA
jgi:hypothetical protein